MRYSTPIIYRIDARDHLTFLGDGWDEFAIANGAEWLRKENVLGRSLWGFITNHETRALFDIFIHRVRRAGESVKVPFRCDAPAQRRFMELELSSGPAGVVEFRSWVRRVEDRAPMRLWDPTVGRGPSLLRVCSWCKKVAVGVSHWVEVETAVEAYRFFENQALPRITHGICEMCQAPLLGDEPPVRDRPWRIPERGGERRADEKTAGSRVGRRDRTRARPPDRGARQAAVVTRISRAACRRGSFRGG